MTPPPSMPAETEENLRRRLHRYAATTRTSPDGLGQIVDRATRAAETRPGQRRWLQGAVAGIAAVALALVLVARTADQAEVDKASGTGVAPTIEGGVFGLVQDSSNCSSDVCPGSDVMRLELPSLAFERLTTEARATSVALAEDGRILATSESSHGLIEVGVETVSQLPSGPDLVAVAVGPSGEQATVVSVIEDGASSGTTTNDLRVEGETVIRGAVALSVPTFDPTGRLAVLQARPSTRHLFHDTDLVVFDGITEVARQRVRGIPPSGALSARPALSWSSQGLVAISGGRMDSFQGRSGDEALNTTLIVEPDTGATIRTIEGWHGLAWSPDGTGLLLTRPVAPGTTEVAVAYGPSLISIENIGRVDGYLTGLVWRPSPPPTLLDVAGVTYELRLDAERVCLEGGLLPGEVCQGPPGGDPQARLDPTRGSHDNVLFVVVPEGASLMPPEGVASATASAAHSTVLVGHVADEFACVRYTNAAGVDGLISVGLTFPSDPTRPDPGVPCGAADLEAGE